MIGIIDDGLDVLHTAFCSDTGNTRIIRLWDQSADGDGGDGMPFGTLYTADNIDGFIADGRAPVGLSSAHGTRVASIAAGRRSRTLNTDALAFAGGVAPDAQIIFVKLRHGNTSDGVGTAIAQMLALDFVADAAKTLGLPYVVNLSFGSNIGAHDGTAMLENHIEMLTIQGTTPGACIVKSAGNEQVSGSQATLEVKASLSDELIWNSRSVDRSSDVIDVWFNAMDHFNFRVFQPEDLGPGATDELSIDRRLVDNVLPNGNRVRLTYDPLNASNGDAQVTVQIFPGDAERIRGGDWRLLVQGADQAPAGGVLHAWIERNERRPIKFKDALSGTGRITIPGTARSIITVGAVKNEIAMQRWKSSSRGPTRDGRYKPDLSAPGAGVTSAIANSLTKSGPRSGTSFAAPHVSGAIALLMSYRERLNLKPLNAVQIQTILTQNCHGFDGSWNRFLGYGVLNIATTFHALDNFG